MTDKYSYLAKNTLLFTLSSFGSKLLSFLLVSFYTDVLTTKEYGTADLVTTSSNLLIFCVTLCIADAVLRFTISNLQSRFGIFGYGLRVVLLGCLIAGVGILIIGIINPFDFEPYFYIFLFLTTVSNALNQLLSNYLRAIDKIGSVAFMGVLVTFFTIICNLVLLLVFKYGIIGYLISFVVGYSFSSVYGFIVVLLNDKKSIFKVCDKDTRKNMLSYSIPLIFNGVAWWMNNSIDRYFIVYFCDMAADGLYAAASKIPTIISVVNQIFNQAWNLSAIKEYDKEDSQGFFSNIYKLYNCVLVISCSMLVLLNIPLAKLLFKKEFFVAWELSAVLLVTAVFAALSGFFGSVFVAVKKSKVFAVSTIIAAVVNVILNGLLIPRFGALGGAIATAISFIVVWLIRYVYVLKFIDLRINLTRDIITYILIGVQIVFNQLNNHFYLGQVIIFILIVVLYRKELIQVCLGIRNYIIKIVGKRNNKISNK